MPTLFIYTLLCWKPLREHTNSVLLSPFPFFKKTMEPNSVWFLFCLLFLLGDQKFRKFFLEEGFLKSTLPCSISSPLSISYSENILVNPPQSLRLISPSAPLWLQFALKCLCPKETKQKISKLSEYCGLIHHTSIALRIWPLEFGG